MTNVRSDCFRFRGVQDHLVHTFRQRMPCTSTGTRRRRLQSSLCHHHHDAVAMSELHGHVLVQRAVYCFYILALHATYCLSARGGRLRGGTWSLLHTGSQVQVKHQKAAELLLLLLISPANQRSMSARNLNPGPVLLRSSAKDVIRNPTLR